MRFLRNCHCLRLQALTFLFISAFAAPGTALTVTFEYALVVSSAKGNLGEAPFTPWEDVQITGAATVDFQDGARRATLLANSFAIDWENGSYDSGAADDARFSENIALDGSAQEIFRFQDRSGHSDLGEYTFDLLRLDVMVPSRSTSSETDGFFFGSLADTTKNTFELRFTNGAGTLTYSGYIAFLEPQVSLASGQQALSAVPLPSSAASLLGSLALIWSLRKLRRRA